MLRLGVSDRCRTYAADAGKHTQEDSVHEPAPNVCGLFFSILQADSCSTLARRYYGWP
jgi:hypothetical protein